MNEMLEVYKSEVWLISSVGSMNENKDHLVDTCTKKRLFLANTSSQHNLIHRYK